TAPGMEVVALADSDTRSARAWARELGGKISLYSDLSSLLNAETPPNALLIASPLCDRPATILAATACCQAILCDPPFAPTLEATGALLRSVAEAGVLFLPALPRRFDPLFRRAGELESTETPGVLHQVRCEWSFPTHRTFAAEVGGESEAGN